MGTYQVQVTADTVPGGQVTVRVGWEFPYVYGSLMPLFGGANQPLKGEAVSEAPEGGVVRRLSIARFVDRRIVSRLRGHVQRRPGFNSARKRTGNRQSQWLFGRRGTWCGTPWC